MLTIRIVAAELAVPLLPSARPRGISDRDSQRPATRHNYRKPIPAPFQSRKSGVNNRADRFCSGVTDSDPPLAGYSPRLQQERDPHLASPQPQQPGGRSRLRQITLATPGRNGQAQLCDPDRSQVAAPQPGHPVQALPGQALLSQGARARGAGVTCGGKSTGVIGSASSRR